MQINKFSLKKDGELNITEHFKVKEFACKDGSDEILIDIDGVKKLERIRQLITLPITVPSAYRTETYNKSINGSKNSYHCRGQAFDIMSALDPYIMALYCAKVGFNGIILYKDFVHCDTRDVIYFYKNI